MILAAGLTPAWQRIYVLDALRAGAVNRAREAHACASGKAVNVAIALRFLGGETCALVPLGGATGTSLAGDLQELAVPVRPVATRYATRVCTTLVDTQGGLVTELVENAGPLQPEEQAAFLQAYTELAANAESVVLSGSLPARTPATFYRDLLAATRCPVVLDARGPELLAALERRPLIVKPNRDELGATLGRTLDEPDVEDAMREIHDRGAQWVVVSHGPQELFVLGEGRLHRLRPPSIAVVNSIGSGDCLAAGMAWAITQGRDVRAAVRFGMACAADNAVQLLPGRLDAQRVRERLDRTGAD